MIEFIERYCDLFSEVSVVVYFVSIYNGINIWNRFFVDIRFLYF